MLYCELIGAAPGGLDRVNVVITLRLLARSLSFVPLRHGRISPDSRAGIAPVAHDFRVPLICSKLTPLRGCGNPSLLSLGGGRRSAEGAGFLTTPLRSRWRKGQGDRRNYPRLHSTTRLRNAKVRALAQRVRRERVRRERVRPLCLPPLCLPPDPFVCPSGRERVRPLCLPQTPLFAQTPVCLPPPAEPRQKSVLDRQIPYSPPNRYADPLDGVE